MATNEHDITKEDAEQVIVGLELASAISKRIFNRVDPKTVFQVYELIQARAHCCRIEEPEEKESWQ